VTRGVLQGLLWRALLGALALAIPPGANAHPMGNFSISHYTAIQIEPGAIRLRYLVDLAEIPTFQALQESSLPTDPQHPLVQAYLARTLETLRDTLVLEVDGQRLALQAESSDLAFPLGAGGLPTLRIGAVYRATPSPVGSAVVRVLTYRDGNYPGRAGWKEIVARAAPGVRLIESTVPARDRSRELTEYPTDPSVSSPERLEAQVAFASSTIPATVAGLGSASTTAPDGPAPGPAERARLAPKAPAAPASREPARVVDAARTRPLEPQDGLAPSVPASPHRAEGAPRTPRDAFTALIAGGPLGPGMLLFAVGVAISLGALHALEPGHGKAIVAAYLVGSRGTAGHALLLGLLVTASHTAGVYLLGAVTLYASRYVVPERLYPWLGTASGLLIALLGVSLLYRRLVAPRAAPGAGAPGHAHDEHGALSPSDHDEVHARDVAHGHDHAHGHHHHHHVPDGPVSLRALVALGVSGGIVPCPAALVVLLSAVAMGRVGLGFLLIVAFSVGLAAVLIGIGLVVVYAGRLVARLGGTGIDGPLVRRWLPLTSAAVITVSGVVITVQALGG
jgi:nickel/cobalt exporter